jgi:hypothetical protein
MSRRRTHGHRDLTVTLLGAFVLLGALVATASGDWHAATAVGLLLGAGFIAGGGGGHHAHGGRHRAGHAHPRRGHHRGHA